MQQRILDCYILWKQCSRFSIQVTLTNMWEPWGHEQNDATIMDLAVTDMV